MHIKLHFVSKHWKEYTSRTTFGLYLKIYYNVIVSFSLIDNHDIEIPGFKMVK